MSEGPYYPELWPGSRKARLVVYSADDHSFPLIAGEWRDPSQGLSIDLCPPVAGEFTIRTELAPLTPSD